MEKLFIRILETFFEALSNISRYHLIMLLCDGMLVYKNTYFPWATVIGASGVVVTIFYEVVNIILFANLWNQYCILLLLLFILWWICIYQPINHLIKGLNIENWIRKIIISNIITICKLNSLFCFQWVLTNNFKKKKKNYQHENHCELKTFIIL